MRLRSLLQLLPYILLLNAEKENSIRNVSLLSPSMESKKLRNMACARACKKVSKLLPNMTHFDTIFHLNVSLAQKNRLRELSYDLFELEFRVSEVKDALQTVANEVACKCPRIRDKIEKIDACIDEGQVALAIRFDDIKRNPDLQED